MNTTTTELPETSREDKFFGIETTIGEEDKSAEPDIEIETDDAPEKETKSYYKKPDAAVTSSSDDDEELQQYSEGVQKRIKKMRWKQGEVERERDAIKAERDEAFRVAQTLHGRNLQYEQTINTGEARLVAEIQARASNDLAIAKAAYSQAYETGDTAKIVEAQELMLNATADVRAANQYGNDYSYRSNQYASRQQQRPFQAPVQRQVPSVPKPTEGASDWAEDNPWFGDADHADMTALAYGVHENLIKRKGIKPDTPQYFQAIDTEMRQRFPEYFSDGQGSGKPVSTQRSKISTVVGSGQRESGSSSRKVKLTASQVTLAKRLGITIEQYAKQLIKGN